MIPVVTIQERLRALRAEMGARAALRAEREAAVASTEFGTATALWIPEVPLAPQQNAAPPALTDDPDVWDVVAGLDAQGRAAIVRRARGTNDEAPAAIVAHPSEERESDSGGEWVLHARVLTWSGSRLEIVCFLTHASIAYVQWVDHDEAGRPVRFTTAGVSHNSEDRGVSEVTCEWEGDRCLSVRDGDVVRTGEYDADGLVRIHSGEHVLWDRALHGYEPDPLSEEQALAVWVEAVAGAAERAVAGTEAAVIKVAPLFRLDDEPTAYVVDHDYLREAAQRVGLRDAVWQHWERRVPLLPLLDDGGLRAWRCLRQLDAEDRSPGLADALQRRLAATDWPGGALPLVIGPYDDLWARAEQVLGRERVAALESGHVAAERPAVERPPEDRDELLALLRAFELPASIAEQARWGLALVAGGTRRSRLGGRPDLPGEWPVHDGRPLTHLVTIAFDELPAIEGRDDLPADGSLVFLAALSEEDELWEPTPADDPRVRVIYVPADAATTLAEPPEGSVDDGYEIAAVLPERRVAFAPVLTIPERVETLSAAEQLGYDQLHEALCEVTPGLWTPPHLLLGHPNITQPYAVELTEYVLLHVGWDEDLEFQFLDGGDLTIHGAADDVRAGRWERLTVTPNSC